MSAEIAFKPLGPEDSPKLAALALTLCPLARRARFGAAVCDHAVSRHYRRLDWSRCFGWGAFARRRLEAAIEFYADDADPRRCEATALGLPGAAYRLGAALAAQAFADAARRGAGNFCWVEAEAPDPWREVLRAAASDWFHL